MNTETTPRPVPPSPWAAPHLIGASPIRSFGFLGLRIAAITVFALADVIVIKGTVDIVLQLSDEVSWFVSLLLALGAVVMAATAGHLSRVAAADGGSQVLAHLPIAGWLALGIALVALRSNAATWTVPPPVVEGVAAPAFDEAAMHHGLAGLLALLFLASGIWSYVEGRHLINPTAIAYLFGERRLERLRTAEIEQAGLAHRAEEDLQRARDAVAALDPARRAAEDARRALAGQLVHEARVRMAIHLADPASTGVTEIAPLDPGFQPTATGRSVR